MYCIYNRLVAGFLCPNSIVSLWVYIVLLIYPRLYLGFFLQIKKDLKDLRVLVVFFLVELQSNKALNSYWLHYERKKERQKLRQTIAEYHKVHVFAGRETELFFLKKICSRAQKDIEHKYVKYTCSMETVQQNGRFTLFSSKFSSNIYSILFARPSKGSQSF